MSLFEIICIAVALSMDAAAVSLSNGMIYREKGGNSLLLAPVLFGLFQGLMPLLGYFTGGLFINYIGRFANILVCVILSFLGLKMIFDGFKHESEIIKLLTPKLILAQAVATSIDAFAVGIGFRASAVNVYYSCAIIAAATFMISLVSVAAGKFFGKRTGDKAVVFGGAILVIIGIKSLF